MGDIQPLAEYQSQEDKARNRPVRPRIDEQTGKRLFRATIAVPAVVLEGLTVQPRAEVSGQAKWITWVVRACLRGVDASSAVRGSSAMAA